MINWLVEIFNATNFLPHRFCIAGSASLLIISVVSNLLIFFSYFSIPAAIAYFVRNRQDLKIKPVLWLFAAFILACGTTHLLHAITYWQPWYWLEATLDALTAIVSVYTAMYLWPLLPKLLNLPNPEQLLELNRQLQFEINERKSIEEELRQEISFSKMVMNSTPGVFYRLDTHGRLVEWNDTLAALLGEDGLKAAQANVLSIIADHDKILIAHKIAEGFANGFADVQAELKLAGGELRCFYFVGRTLLIDGENYLLGTGVDVTERKAIETELRASEQKFRLLIDRVPLSLGLVSKTGELLYINERFKRVFGYTLDDIPTIEHWYSSAYPDENYRQQVISSWTAAIEHAINTDTDIEADEYHVTCKNGEIRIMLISGIFFEDNILAAFVDITARKRVEEQLRNSESFTNSILNSLAAHITVLNDDGIIIAVNSSWKQFAKDSGVSEISQNMVGKNYFDVCQKAFDEEHFEEAVNIQYGIMSVLEGTRDNFQLEYSLRLPDQQLWFFMRVLPLKDSQQGIVISHENITQRKQTEQALKLSEARFRSIIEISPVPMALNDEQQNISFLNPAFVTTFGYDLSDIPTLSDWWPKAYPDPEYRQWVAATWQAALEESERKHRVFIPMELTICCKNGTEKNVLASAAAISATFNSLHLVVLYDITEHKQAEQARRASESQLWAFYELDLVGLTITSPEKGWLRSNDCLCKMLEYSESELHQMTWTQLTHPDDLAADVEQFEKLLANEINGYSLEKRFISRTGKIIYTQLVVRCVRKANGEVDYVTAMVQDITERKKLEQQLRNVFLYTRNLIEVSLDPLVTISADGKITDVNKAAEKVTGFTREQLINSDFADYFTEPEQARAGYQEVFSKGSVTDYALVIKHHDGQLTNVLYNAVVYHNESGEIAGVFAAARDVSTLKQIEAELKSSNADLEQFAYSVSHDMRQPLRAISSHLQLLARSLKDRLDQDETINLNFALEGAKRMDAMIVSLLEYSRVGRKTETKAWISSRVALNEALDFLSLAIADAKAEIKVTGEWGQVYASFDELSRLFMNLTSNAIKYHDENQPPHVEINSIVTADTWKVSFCDHGIGIDPQQLDRLFKFFSRLQSRSRFEGTGMGLALCRRIVEHHGGQIWAESAGEGQGCCFIFELPLLPDREIEKSI